MFKVRKAERGVSRTYMGITSFAHKMLTKLPPTLEAQATFGRLIVVGVMENQALGA